MPLMYQNTVEHTYDGCPKYSELGIFRIIAYLYVSIHCVFYSIQILKVIVQTPGVDNREHHFTKMVHD